MSENQTPGGRWRDHLALLVFIVLLSLIITLKHNAHESSSERWDFQAFYAAAKMITHGQGHQLYDLKAQAAAQMRYVDPTRQVSVPDLPFPYFAATALVFVPFSLLPMTLAYAAWTTTNLVLLVASLRFLQRILPLPRNWTLASAILFAPTYLALLNGQITLLVLFLIVFALFFLVRGKPFLSGVFLGLATLKYQLVIGLLAVLLLRGMWKVVAGSALSASLLAAISVAITGVRAALHYPAFIREFAGATVVHPALNTGLRGLFWFVLRHEPALWLIGILSVALIAAAALSWSDDIDGFSVAIAVSLLASYHAHILDLVLLLVPFAALASRVRQSLAAAWSVTVIALGYIAVVAHLDSLFALGCYSLIVVGFWRTRRMPVLAGINNPASLPNQPEIRNLDLGSPTLNGNVDAKAALEWSAGTPEVDRSAREGVVEDRPSKLFRDLAMIAVVISAVLSFGLWAADVGSAPGLDMRSYYMAGYMARTGKAPLLFDAKSQLYYQNLLVSQGNVALPYIHPPYEALLYAPFTFLSYRGAYFAFLALNLLVLAWTFWVLRPDLARLAKTMPWLPPAMFAFFIPVQIALFQGQDSIILLAILVGSRFLLLRNRNLAAGAVLALGLYRFQIVVPIALLFLVWRRWRFVAGFAASLAVLVGVSLWMVRWSGLQLYYQLVLSLSHRISTTDLLIRVSPQQMPNLRGVISFLPRLTDPWAAALTALASLAVLFFAAKRAAAPSLTFAIPAAVLVSYHLLTHDMAVLLLPIALVINQYFVRDKASGPPQWVLWSALLLFAAPAAQFFVSKHAFVLVVLPILLFLVLLPSRETSLNDRPISQNVNAPSQGMLAEM